MQRTVGKIDSNSDVKGVGDFLGKAIKGSVTKEELIEITLQNDEIKIDGNFAVAWSDTLEFTVEKSGKSLIGSAVSSEGFVNIYRGTGKILIAPVLSLSNYSISTLNNQTVRSTVK